MFIEDDSMFSLVSIMIPLIFIIVIGTILFAIVSSLRQWHKNNQQPILTVDAKIVTKRVDTESSNHHHDNHHHHSTHSYYYVTFEVESGDRMELKVEGNEYGKLADGDVGKLTFQGTRYLQFERNITKE